VPALPGAFSGARSEGAIVACDLVWAETAAWFPAGTTAAEAFLRLELGFVPLDERAAILAGDAWRAYRRRGGSRGRIVSDFLIAPPMPCCTRTGSSLVTGASTGARSRSSS
jgi:hypothetical protein